MPYTLGWSFKRLHGVTLTLHAMTLNTMPNTYTYGDIIFYAYVSERSNDGERACMTLKFDLEI